MVVRSCKNLQIKFVHEKTKTKRKLRKKSSIVKHNINTAILANVCMCGICISYSNTYKAKRKRKEQKQTKQNRTEQNSLF